MFILICSLPFTELNSKTTKSLWSGATLVKTGNERKITFRACEISNKVTLPVEDRPIVKTTSVVFVPNITAGQYCVAVDINTDGTLDFSNGLGLVTKGQAYGEISYVVT